MLFLVDGFRRVNRIVGLQPGDHRPGIRLRLVARADSCEGGITVRRPVGTRHNRVGWRRRPVKLAVQEIGPGTQVAQGSGELAIVGDVRSEVARSARGEVGT